MIQPAQWLIKNRIIYAYGEGLVSLAEMNAHSERVLELLDEGISPVHIVLDGSSDFRPEIVDLRSGLDNLHFIHHNSIGWTVQILDGKHGMRFVARLIAGFARISYQAVDNRQGALDFLRVMDTSLDWSQIEDSVLFDSA